MYEETIRYIKQYEDIQTTKVATENRLYIPLDKPKKGGGRSKYGNTARSGIKIDDIILESQYTILEELKLQLGKEIEKYVNKEPLWVEWLSGVRGIGKILTAKILKVVSENNIENFPSVSSLRAYFEYAPVCGENGLPTRSKEYMTSWYAKLGEKEVRANKNLRDQVKSEEYAKRREMLRNGNYIHGRIPSKWKGDMAAYHRQGIMYDVVESLITHKGAYYNQYLKFKQEDAKKNPHLIKKTKESELGGVIEKRARIKLAQLFIAHLWETLRTIKKLPAGRAYVFEKLGHSHYLPPLKDS